MTVAYEGYNVFVVGPAGSGRPTLLQSALEERARGVASPSDWLSP
jgi:ribose 1,5-bisphosphokinase PhnN